MAEFYNEGEYYIDSGTELDGNLYEGLDGEVQESVEEIKEEQVNDRVQELNGESTLNTSASEGIVRRNESKKLPKKSDKRNLNPNIRPVRKDKSPKRPAIRVVHSSTSKNTSNTVGNGFDWGTFLLGVGSGLVIAYLYGRIVKRQKKE